MGTQVHLREGLLIADKYTLVESIGSGSMGAVWKAKHAMLGHAVAIKFLHSSVEAHLGGRGRFELEAKLSARLGEASRHICRVTDFGVMGAETAYVVMDLLQGEELSTRLRNQRQLPLPLLVEIVAQLCRALTVAHEAGVIHRDLKPANVFLCRAEEGQDILVKLLDFGVAKTSVEHEDTQATRAGTIFGTPGYMSPEQIASDGELDFRSDLWSVAVMTYRMAVGRTPFGSGNLHELGMRILSIDPPTPSSLRPDLPKGFDAWMRKGLARNREDRFGSAAELASALGEAVDAQASTPASDAPPSVSPWSGDIGQGAVLPSAEDPTLPERPRKRYVARVVLAAAVLGVAATAAIGSRLHRPAPPAGVLVASPTIVATAPVVERSVDPDPVDPVDPVGPGAEIHSAPEQPAPPAASDPSVAGGAPPHKTLPKASKPAPAGSASIEERGGALWNKKDEL